MISGELIDMISSAANAFMAIRPFKVFISYLKQMLFALR